MICVALGDSWTYSARVGRSARNFCPPTASREPISRPMMSVWGSVPMWVAKSLPVSKRMNVASALAGDQNSKVAFLELVG